MYMKKIGNTNKYCSNLIDQIVNASIWNINRGHALQWIVTTMDIACIILIIHPSTEAQCPLTKIGSEMWVVDFQFRQSSKNYICQLIPTRDRETKEKNKKNLVLSSKD